jgi:hypothetical protein
MRHEKRAYRAAAPPQPSAWSGLRARLAPLLAALILALAGIASSGMGSAHAPAGGASPAGPRIDAAIPAPTVTRSPGVAPPTLPEISGLTTTAPTTVPLLPATPATVALTPPGALPIPTPPQTDSWRWVLVSVLVVLAAVFVVRGMRRQRRGP